MPATITKGNLFNGPATDVKIGVDGSEVSVGSTLAPVVLRKEVEHREFTVEQLKGTVKREESRLRYFITTAVAEKTLANLQKAFNQVAGNLVASTLTIDEDVLGEQSIIIEGPGPNGSTRTVDCPICVSIRTGDYVMSMAGQAGIEIEFEILQNPSDKSFLQIRDA